MNRLVSFFLYAIILIAGTLAAETSETVYIGFPNHHWTQQNASINLQLNMPFASSFLKSLRRQAVLIASRDELGAATRDAFLSEAAPETAVKIEDVDRFIVDHVEHFEQNIFAQKIDYPRFLAELEKFSRNDFVKALEELGAAKVSVSVETAKTEDLAAIEKLLHEYTVISQFEAVRRIHAAIRQYGETPARLTQLVRGYTQLQLLTNCFPRDSHRVFQARAMLYAQRLIAKYGAKPELLAVRAAAWSLNHFHRIAREEFTAVPQDTEQADWIRLARLYADFDIRGITSFADSSKDSPEIPFAKILKFFLLVFSDDNKIAGEFGQVLLTEFPDCSWLYFELFAVNHYPDPYHTQNGRVDENLAKKIAPAIRKMENLPQPVSQANQELRKTFPNEAGGGGVLGALIGQGGQSSQGFSAEEFYKNLAKLFERMNETAAKDDRHEPSLSVLATLLQDEMFYVNLFMLNYGSEDDLIIVPIKTAFASHPLVNHLGLACRDAALKEEFKKKLFETKIPYEMLSQVRAGFNFPGREIWGQGNFIAPNIIACRFADQENVRDMLAYHQEVRQYVNKDVPLYTTKILMKICPKNPFVVMDQLNRNWIYNAEEAEEIAKEFAEYTNVYEALSNQYRKNSRMDKAFDIMRKEIKLNPNNDQAQRIADLYLENGDFAGAIDVLKEYLSLPGAADERGYVTGKLGRLLLAEGKTKEAETYFNKLKKIPYGDLGMAQFLLWTGKFDEAERMYQNAVNTYSYNRLTHISGMFQWWGTCYRGLHTNLADVTDMIFEYYKPKENSPLSDGLQQVYYLSYCLGIPVREEFGNDPAVHVYFMYNKPMAGFIAFLEALDNKDEVKAAALLKLLYERGTLLSKADFSRVVGKARLPSNQELPRTGSQALRLLATLFALDRRSQNPGSLNQDAVETLLRISYGGNNVTKNEAALFMLYFLGRYYTICGKTEKGLECYRRVLAAKNTEVLFPPCFVIKELRDAGLSEKEILQMIQTDAKLPVKPVSKAEAEVFSMRLTEALNTAEAATLSSLEVTQDEAIFEVRRCELPISDILPDDGAVWNIPDTECVRKFGQQCYYAALSPDGKRIATAGNDMAAALWDAETGERLAVKKTENSRGSAVAFAPDGNSVLYGETNGNVVLWKPQFDSSQEQTLVWEQKIHPWTGCIVLSPDGKSFCTTSEDDKDGGVFLWNMDGKLIRSMKHHKGKVYRAAFFSNGTRLVTASKDKTSFVYHVNTGKPILCLQGHREEVRAVAVSPDDKVIVTGGDDDTVIVWNAQTGEPIRRLGMFDGDVISLTFSPDGSKLAVTRNWNGENVYILDTKTWKLVLQIPGHGFWDCQPAWSSDGRFFVTCGDNTRIWKLPNEEEETASSDKFADQKEILLKDFEVKGISAQTESPSFDTFKSSRKEFTDSLWAHAASRFVVPLNGHWQTFKTSFGISTTANLGDASCFFVVVGDGKELFRSELVRDNLDRPLELDVRNIKRLELIVDPNGNISYDHGVWLTPKLLR